jgi:Domain of unknown function(DUF2779)
MPDDSQKRRYLTKSRFRLAHECPTKLAYADDPNYGNTQDGDEFLKALAEGGFQVGALAKLYHPGGVEIETLDPDKALSATQKLLNQEEVTIYEAALRFQDLFVRVDILKKKGSKIFLYEVKAKSFDPEKDQFFQKRSKERKLAKEWEPLLYDIAFQTFVAQRALQGHAVTAYLVLVDKSAEASIDGLNQNFMLGKSHDGKTTVFTKTPYSAHDLGNKLLVDLKVDEEVRFIRSQMVGPRSFEDFAEYLADHYAKNEKMITPLGAQCKNCEFHIDDKLKASGLRSGFDECWKKAIGDRVSEPLVLDLWFGSFDKLISEKKFFLKDVTESDLPPDKKSQGPGLTRSERQLKQVSGEPYFDADGLSAEMAQWKFPLHFIDFETAQPALPFTKGRRPYEVLAFQFSHHLVHEDGRIEHRGQYLNVERGKFPNFDFVAALKAQLDEDQGTIFRYADHENSVLCQIFEQLKTADLRQGDIETLSAWIQSITRKTDDKGVVWQGERSMVDMRELVVRYEYNPLTEGSNSLKAVLPATLQISEYLKEKYSAPLYGAPDGIPSLNFKNFQWIHRDAKGNLEDPYRRLGPILGPGEVFTKTLAPLTEINNGAAAMLAYHRLQFTEIGAEESQRIRQALLRYCELDTLAMVMLFEHWRQATQLPRSLSVAAAIR